MKDFDPCDLEVQISELLVATADQADVELDEPVQEVLKLLREHMAMDVVFVSEFTGGQRVFRYVEQGPGNERVTVGASDDLEASWCQRVVDGRLPGYIEDAAGVQATGAAPRAPFAIGTHLSVPIVLSDGEVYGTLCCFSHHVNGKVNKQDLQKLSYTAQLTAERIETARRESQF